jgi:hypothetical protein
VKPVQGSTTTIFVGSHFEWTGSDRTMVMVYFSGRQRPALRVKIVAAES